MYAGSVPFRPLWPGSIPTVIPARGFAGAGGRSVAPGVAVAGPGEGRTAAGEAAASPASPAARAPVTVLPQAVARQAATASSHTWLARVRPVLPVRSGSLSAPPGGSAAEGVDALNLPPAALMEGRDREHGPGIAGLAGAGPGVLLVGEDEQPGPVAVEQLHPGVGDPGGDDQFLGRRVLGHQREQGVVLADRRAGEQALRGPPGRRRVRVVVGEDRVDRGGDLPPDRGGRGPVGERRVLRGGAVALAVGVQRGPHPEPAEDHGGGAERGGGPPGPAAARPAFPGAGARCRLACAGVLRDLACLGVVRGLVRAGVGPGGLVLGLGDLDVLVSHRWSPSRWR